MVVSSRLCLRCLITPIGSGMCTRIVRLSSCVGFSWVFLEGLGRCGFVRLWFLLVSLMSLITFGCGKG